MTPRAFVGTNRTDEPITSGFPVIRPRSMPSAEITFYKQTYTRTYQASGECRHFGDILPS